MQVIPVLDIKNSLVVRGVMGERANYRPIETPLSPSPDPLAVMAGLMAVHPFKALYIADLDAIEGEDPADTLQAGQGVRRRGMPDAALIRRIHETHPSVTIWLDAGVTNFEGAMAVAALPGVRAVIGSESIDGPKTLRRLAGAADIALSLDFRGDTFIGPPEILADETLWPQTLIVMTLAKVGSGAGPDLDKLAEVKARAGNRKVFAAGGVRGPDDLRALAERDISGALIASALHDGRIAASDLKAFAG